MRYSSEDIYFRVGEVISNSVYRGSLVGQNIDDTLKKYSGKVNDTTFSRTPVTKNIDHALDLHLEQLEIESMRTN